MRDNIWHEIKSDKDVEKFMEDTAIMDDSSSLIVSVNYNRTEHNNLLLTIDNWYFGRMEIFFEDVCSFRFAERSDGLIYNISGCSLEIRTDLLGRTRNDKLIVWTDGCAVSHHNGHFDFEKDNCMVIAYNMRYRFTKEIPEPEKRLKEIIEENYLEEILWDYFWKNFDDYITSDEAIQYNITGRDSIKPCFYSYGLKHFPDSSDQTLIVMTIKFYHSENDKYLGYYDLLFNLNLEITDDCFNSELEIRNS